MIPFWATVSDHRIMMYVKDYFHDLLPEEKTTSKAYSYLIDLGDRPNVFDFFNDGSFSERIISRGWLHCLTREAFIHYNSQGTPLIKEHYVNGDFVSPEKFKEIKMSYEIL